MSRRILLLVFLLMFVLSACSQSSSPSDVIENYLAALVAKDDVLAINLSCAAWEANAKADGASFEGVEVTLEDASCTVMSEDGQTGVVACKGKFVFSYAGGEAEEIGLDRRDYLVSFEGGDWRMCGYQ